MDQKIINIGEKRQPFILAFEQTTALPAWMTTMTEVWVQTAGDSIYNAIKEHPLFCINSNLYNSKNFAATMRIDNFQSLKLNKEAEIFQKYIFILLDVLLRECPVPVLSTRMYVSFFSDSTPNVVNCMLELDKGLIMFGAELNN